MNTHTQAASQMTEGPIWKRILFFALPLMVGNLFQQLYNTVDNIVVGNLGAKDEKKVSRILSGVRQQMDAFEAFRKKLETIFPR